MIIDEVRGGHIFLKLNDGDQALSTAEAPYCSSHSNFSCTILDAQDMVESFGGHMFIKTGSYTSLQARLCPPYAAGCNGKVWGKVGGSTRGCFTLMPEYNYVVLEHALMCSNVHRDLFCGASLDYDGYLLYPNGTVFKKFPSSQRWYDSILLQDLLRAAGVDALDEQSDFNGHMRASTFRESGVSLIMRVHYSNLGPQPSYSYKISRVPNSRVRKIRTVAHQNGTRSLIRHFGIRLAVHISGEVGQWNIRSLANGIILPSVTMTSVVYTIMYYYIVYISPPGNLEEMIRDNAIEKLKAK